MPFGVRCCGEFGRSLALLCLPRLMTRNRPTPRPRLRQAVQGEGRSVASSSKSMRGMLLIRSVPSWRETASAAFCWIDSMDPATIFDHQADAALHGPEDSADRGE